VHEQRRLAAHASRQSRRRPVLYDRHMLFVDFAQFGLPHPAYINMVREPVRMQVSAFHFWRECICRSGQRFSFCSGVRQVGDAAQLCNLSMDEGAFARP
jgi:dermatan/chondrotin sulfate uronyl 2-O-sulfotransferase UST